MKQPVIVASIQYRLAHFGFSASKEMEDAGLLNLGFEDQRNAMHWVQQHISKVKGANSLPRCGGFDQTLSSHH